ncbi:hypothetical protein CDAR_229101 [Caerostris darwini]|uniref:Uncharacterized protein n=1 Tax=Caerostris darwini TaxID=1538125 RepID=A0AAV4RHK6_9ARAC|nr:hypothetical protein CDAR_229041 [Caerostris darwini]GIY20797.1 hypothetical protein CDAR_229101 [Caerostris darwini]
MVPPFRIALNAPELSFIADCAAFTTGNPGTMDCSSVYARNDNVVIFKYDEDSQFFHEKPGGIKSDYFKGRDVSSFMRNQEELKAIILWADMWECNSRVTTL